MKIGAIARAMFFIAFPVMILSQACQKEEVNDPPPGGTGTGGPNLPPAAYNYSGVLDDLPAYYKSILLNNPGFDNSPPDNPVTNDGATLGRVLFYDKSLSANNTIACASCHHQDKSFVDGLPVSEGFEGGHTRRNSMAVLNARFIENKKMFWDMRAATLEDQVLMPITDHIEMGMASLTALENKLRSKSYYAPLFQKAFGSPEITSAKTAKALAQFVRSVVSFRSKYDQGIALNFSNFTTQEKNGMTLVNSRCGECHNDRSTFIAGTNPSYFFGTQFGPAMNGLDLVYTDNGAGELTGDPRLNGMFKIPTLRNIELTAPYMHDGRFSTLAQVVEHYSGNIKAHPNLDIQLPAGGFNFSETQKAEIIAFLKTLTDRTITTDVKYSDPFR